MDLNRKLCHTFSHVSVEHLCVCLRIPLDRSVLKLTSDLPDGEKYMYTLTDTRAQCIYREEFTSGRNLRIVLEKSTHHNLK